MIWLKILIIWTAVSTVSLGAYMIISYLVNRKKENDSEQETEMPPLNYVRGDGVTTCIECGISILQYRHGCTSCHIRLIDEEIPILLPLDWNHNVNCAKTKTLLESQTNITIMPGAYMFIPCTCKTSQEEHHV